MVLKALDRLCKIDCTLVVADCSIYFIDFHQSVCHVVVHVWKLVIDNESPLKDFNCLLEVLLG